MPALRSRTSKLLAPLDGRPKALPVLQQHVPLKPISQNPHCSKSQLRRDRLSWDSPCNGPPIDKADSEESESSSNQSSISLENDDDERLFQETAHEDRNLRFSEDGFWQHSKYVISPEEDFSGEKIQHIKAQPRISLVPLVNTSTRNEERDHHLHKEKPKKSQCEANNVNQTHFVKTESSSVLSYTQNGDTMSENNQTRTTSAIEEDKTNRDCTAKLSLLDDGTECSENDKNVHLVEVTESTRSMSCDNKTSTTDMGTGEGETRLFTVNPQKDKKTFKPLKVAKDKLKMTSVHGAGFNFTPTPSKPSELSQTNIAHQHVPTRELKSAQHSRKPQMGGKPRSKSAVDLITYKDLFQQIQSVDEGPAIYEMFAGPIFENLRVSSACEKLEERHSPRASTRKTKQGHKVKPRSLKAIQKLKRSSGESTTGLAKTKTKPVPPTVKLHPAVVTKKSICKTETNAKLEAEALSDRNTDVSLMKVQDESADYALSTIEEAASKYGSDTLKPEEETLTTSTSSIFVIDYTFMQNHKTTSTQNSTQQVSNVSLLPSYQKPTIDTWTSSSGRCHTMSPVYKRFLDEVGDGPLTDDLLQCLAEELISLDERDTTGSEDPKQNRQFNQDEELVFMSLPHKSPEVNSLIPIFFKSF